MRNFLIPALVFGSALTLFSFSTRENAASDYVYLDNGANPDKQVGSFVEFERNMFTHAKDTFEKYYTTWSLESGAINEDIDTSLKKH